MGIAVQFSVWALLGYIIFPMLFLAGIFGYAVFLRIRLCQRSVLAGMIVVVHLTVNHQDFNICRIKENAERICRYI
jgi:hypothetical protein